MFLLAEMVSKPHLIFSFYLFGIEAILTIIMFIYISKHEMFYASENNIFTNAMLTTSMVP
ncbi:MAG: hypothetical protein WCD89_06630 [Anaerocolumna sp.]